MSQIGLKSVDSLTYTVVHTCNGLALSTAWANKYSTTCPKWPKEYKNFVFKTDYRLMQVKRIAECSDIHEYF